MINVYTVMMALILFLAIIMRGNQKFNKRYIILACIIMFVVYGLRDAYSVGNDSSSSYLHQYQAMEHKGWDELPQLEEGDHNVAFFWLMKIVYVYSGGDYQVFITLISAFIMIVFAHFILRYSCSPVQSFVYYWGLLFYSFMFNALKQSIAMAFVLLAFSAIMTKKPLRFVLMVLIAACFHMPALVFLPAYWISKMTVRYYLVTLSAILALTYHFREDILNLMLNMYDTKIYDTDMRFLANKVLMMIVIVAAAIVLRPPTRDDILYNKLLSLMGVAIVFQTFASYNNTFERLADYYFQFAVVFIPLIFERVKLKRSYLSPKTMFLVKTAAPYLFGAFGVWRFANSVQNTIAMLPYHFCF